VAKTIGQHERLPPFDAVPPAHPRPGCRHRRRNKSRPVARALPRLRPAPAARLARGRVSPGQWKRAASPAHGNRIGGQRWVSRCSRSSTLLGQAGFRRCPRAHEAGGSWNTPPRSACRSVSPYSGAIPPTIARIFGGDPGKVSLVETRSGGLRSIISRRRYRWDWDNHWAAATGNSRCLRLLVAHRSTWTAAASLALMSAQISGRSLQSVRRRPRPR